MPTPVLHLERRGAQRSLTAAPARQGHFDTAIRQKQALEDDAASTARRMAAANALLGALAGEEGRWTGLSKDFDDQIQRLTGAPPARAATYPTTRWHACACGRGSCPQGNGAWQSSARWLPGAGSRKRARACCAIRAEQSSRRLLLRATAPRTPHACEGQGSQ